MESNDIEVERNIMDEVRKKPESETEGWEQRFLYRFVPLPDQALIKPDDLLNGITDFISQELQKAKEEGRQQLRQEIIRQKPMDATDWVIEVTKRKERLRILNLIEDMIVDLSLVKDDIDSDIFIKQYGWNQALESLKEKINGAK